LIRASAQHVEQEAASGIGRVDILIENNQIDTFLAQVLGDLAQM